jgi:Mg/Co/Ni transporter MgtE
MLWIKRTLTELAVGAVLGFIGWCLMGKRLTSALFGSLGGSFSCRADVELGLDKFVSMQLYSAIAGALVAFLGMLVLRRWWAKTRSKPSAPTPPAPTPGVPGAPAS